MPVRTYERAVKSVPALQETGTQIAHAIHGAVLSGGPLTRKIGDLLHGTWLGHPLHPVLTDLTLGAWIWAGVFDAIGLVSGSQRAREAGEMLVKAGCITAVPTALSGMADYSTVPRPAADTAFLHGALNSVILGMYLVSLRDRRRGHYRRGATLSLSALSLGAVSAWLGGHLVYAQQVGVNHSATEAEEDEPWTPVMDTASLAEGRPRCVEANGRRVLLYREGRAVYAIGAVCAHAGGPLEEGEVRGHTVQCPWHDSVFDLRTGQVVHGPSVYPQPVFQTRIREGQIEVRPSPE